MSTSVEHGLISPKPKDKLPVSYVYLQAPQLDGQSAGVLWAGREGQHRGRAKVIIKWRRIARARGEERWKGWQPARIIIIRAMSGAAKGTRSAKGRPSAQEIHGSMSTGYTTSVDKSRRRTPIDERSLVFPDPSFRAAASGKGAEAKGGRVGQCPAPAAPPAIGASDPEPSCCLFSLLSPWYNSAQRSTTTRPSPRARLPLAVPHTKR